jgi:hypothetical protein
VQELKTRGGLTDDSELAAMHCPVMYTAKRDQVFGLVPALLRAQLDVMNVQK